MKRLPQTLTAAALTGALAFGGAAVAQAEPVVPAPMSVTIDGKEYVRQNDGSYVYTPTDEEKKSGAKEETITEEEALATRESANNDEAETGDLNSDVDQLPEGDEDVDTSDLGDNEGIPAPATKKDAEGNEWYQSLKDPAVYVNDPAQVNEEITDEMRDAYAKAFPSEDQKPGFDKKKLAWLALPAALVIGGVTWYLSQDGKTYVKDEARKGQEPTAEEKAASEQMLNANKDEVVAQGGKLAEGDAAQAGAPAAPATDEGTDSVRGMAAETGSNSVAQALAALAVAAMVAAGAFAARRKFFA
ncbi:hypothetical protein [Corynebacterium sp. MSK150]|uniref:hypothetical protein n=1 Tax=Corynebacterium sp. MSK150 TaxID=3050209 RepID=UPI00254DC384|nr:hypothetical protein [Corynebacterium sp. MSK150]MDK8524310.1 hypothetical protein [Corynebacterium sp. MSK150]